MGTESEPEPYMLNHSLWFGTSSVQVSTDSRKSIVAKMDRFCN